MMMFRTHPYLVKLKEAFPRQLAVIEAIKKLIEVNPETSVHHKVSPKERLCLLYNIQAADSPHEDPPHSKHALSMIAPNITEPGMEPVKQRKKIN